jgi:phospholipid/cholesterol/gamma-HCH transport system substrate-binding protein
MSGQASMFKLGFFVLLGLFLLGGTLIWMGQRDSIGDAKNYVSYFSDSVQGVQVGSPVKYQGIDVGKVVDISVAPDPYLVQIIYSLKGEESLARLVMAGISLTGITGMAYIELVPQEASAVAASPRVDFTPPYPVIPSYIRGIQKVMASIETIMGKLSAIDFVGLSQRIDNLLLTVQNILDNQALGDIISSLRTVSENLESFSAELARLGQGGNGQRMSDFIISASREIEETSRNIKTQIEKMELDKLSQKVNLYVDELGESMLRVGQYLQSVSEQLSRLSGRLENAPSDIIFSQPASPLPQEQIK